jgi:hypothetical protein
VTSARIPQACSGLDDRSALPELHEDAVPAPFGCRVVAVPLPNAAGVALFSGDNAGYRGHDGIAGKGFDIDDDRVGFGKLIELEQLGNVNGAVPLEKVGGAS